MIGDKIKQRRLVMGLSLQELADQLTAKGEAITKAGLSKYENNKSMPKAKFIWNLAKVLTVSNDYFFSEDTLEIEWLAFRKNMSLPRKTEEMIKNYMYEYMLEYIRLESVVNINIEDIVLKKTRIDNPGDAEKIADDLRAKWELNSWPIESITQLLEEKGFYVVEYDVAERKFDGLSGIINKKSPLIVSRSNVSVDRKRLSLAHELGHHLIDIDKEFEEQAAYVFASALLIPSRSLIHEIGPRRKNIDINELVLLKEKYGISIQALTKRCYSLGIISESLYKQMFMFFRKNYWHVTEPGRCTNNEDPVRFKKMVFRAYAEGLISKDKAGAILPEFNAMEKNTSSQASWKWRDISSISQQERDVILLKAAEAAMVDYEENSDLMSFTINGDMFDESK